jgi:sec-independent protein translocase protein TatA
MGDIGVPELLIILLVVVVLFGSKRLPDAARSIGRSLRIFKSEVKGLHEDQAPATPAQPGTPAQPAAEPAPAGQAARTDEAHPVPVITTADREQPAHRAS